MMNISLNVTFIEWTNGTSEFMSCCRRFSNDSHVSSSCSLTLSFGSCTWTSSRNERRLFVYIGSTVRWCSIRTSCLLNLICVTRENKTCSSSSSSSWCHSFVFKRIISMNNYDERTNIMPKSIEIINKYKQTNIALVLEVKWMFCSNYWE
jgi:hypothetical protein